jgi:hypothetical protein
VTVAAQPVPAPPNFAELVRQFPEWVKKNIGATVISAAVSGVVGYVVNVWLMAVRYEGSVAPKGAAATSQGNLLSGGLFWAMLPMVACSVVGYRRALGRERFWQDVRGLPMTLVGLFRRDGAHGRAHLLWGAAIALAASLFVSPAVGAILGVGFLVAAPSIIGNMVSSLVSQVWQQVSRRVSPAKTNPLPPAMSAAVGLLGAAVALVAGFLVPGRSLRLVLAVACAGAALFIGQQAKATRIAAVILVVAGAYVLVDFVFALPALADDGGFAECGSTISGWINNCAGADVVRRLAGTGAVIAGITGPIGTFLGGFVSAFAPPGGGSWWEGGSTGGGTTTTEAPPPSTNETTTTQQPEGYTDGQTQAQGEAGGDDEQRRDRYRTSPEEVVETKGERPKPLDPDKGHTVDGSQTAVGPDGEPLKDPRTGTELPVDTDGKVKYGDDWVTPADAANRIKIDNDTLAARQRGQTLVDEVRDIQSKLNDPELDLATRRQLEADLHNKAIEINSDYGAKSILKGDNTGTADIVAGEVKKIYGEVDPLFVDKMNELGVTRGGQPFSEDDMWDIRNKKSKGLGMDRDFALNQKEVQRIRDELAGVEPGSERAHQLQNDLLDAKARSQLEVDANKYAGMLEDRMNNAKTPAERAQIEGQLERVKAQQAAGAEKIAISPSIWNDMAQDAYGKAYGEVTGTDAHKAMQGITQEFNAEAYHDRAVLDNDPRAHPLDKASAEQTASVSPHKVDHNEEAVRRGDMTKGEATMENARGYAKDMDTKLLPLLQADPNVDPGKLGRLEAIQETMHKIGSGEVLPGQADGALKVATGDPSMTMEKAMRIADANLEAGIKMHPDAPEGSRVHDAFGKATDLATFEQLTQQHIAEGKSVGEAMGLAGVQVAAGNAAAASGVVDPTLSMVAGSMLPGGMSNLLPDQMVQNTVGTSWDAARALAADVGTSLGSGELNTTAIDKFALHVADRGNADPFSGYGQAGALAGDLYARTDGGSLAGDLSSIVETGAGAEVLNESMADFQHQVDQGKHGVVLQGYDDIFNAASNLAVDPSTTVGQFVNDVKDIYNHGVGDGYWEDAGMHTKDVLDKTPIVGMVAGGYEAIAAGIGESGSVGGFVSDMSEGAAALGGEAVEGVANAGSSAVKYIKSFF